MAWAYGLASSLLGVTCKGYNYAAFPDQPNNIRVELTDEYLPILEIQGATGTSNADVDMAARGTNYPAYYFEDISVSGTALFTDDVRFPIYFILSNSFSNRYATKNEYANLGTLKLSKHDGTKYKISEVFPPNYGALTFHFSKVNIQCYGAANFSGHSNDIFLTTGDLDHPFTITFEIKNPPTFNVDVISTGPYYKGLTEYTVNVSESEAKVGGTIGQTSLGIDDFYVYTKDKDPTITILPNKTGFTSPKVQVFDSRGQNTIKNLPVIQVLDYSFPEIWNSDVIRCDSNGVQNDEGEYALISVHYKYNETAAESLVKPIVIKNISDNISNHVSWYTSYDSTTGVSNKITFPYAAPDYGTMYGLVDYEFDKFTSYEIWTRLKDSLSGESETYKDVLSLAYYTVDFLAGGYGIAFGKASEAEGFECNMDSAFSKDVNLVINPGLSETDYNLDNVIRRLDWDKDLYPELYIDEVDPLILEMSQSQHGGSHQISIVSNELVDESNLIWEVTGPNRAARIENGLLIVEGNEADESIVHVTVKYNFGGHMLQDSIDVLPQWRLP